MNTRTLRKVILTALASSTLGSPSACDNCIPTTFFYVGDLLVSPLSSTRGTVEAQVTSFDSSASDGGKTSAEASGIPGDPRGTVSRWRPRTLEAIATENMVEGCVRETYGALDATWMARNARDPCVRAAMRRIAHDETRHAALSWQIAEWSSRVLGPCARARIAESRAAAVQQLAAELGAREAPSLVEAGLAPRAAEDGPENRGESGPMKPGRRRRGLG